MTNITQIKSMRPTDGDLIIHCRHVTGDGEMAHAYVVGDVVNGQIVHGAKFFVGGKVVFAKFVTLCDECKLKAGDNPENMCSKSSIFDGTLYN